MGRNELREIPGGKAIFRRSRMGVSAVWKIDAHRRVLDVSPCGIVGDGRLLPRPWTKDLLKGAVVISIFVGIVFVVNDRVLRETRIGAVHIWAFAVTDLFPQKVSGCAVIIHPFPANNLA